MMNCHSTSGEAINQMDQRPWAMLRAFFLFTGDVRHEIEGAGAEMEERASAKPVLPLHQGHSAPVRPKGALRLLCPRSALYRPTAPWMLRIRS